VSYILILLELKKRKKFTGITKKNRTFNESISGINSPSSKSFKRDHSLVYSNNSKQLKIRFYASSINKSSNEISDDKITSSAKIYRKNNGSLSKVQMKTTKNVVLLIILFFCSWFPYTILTILTQFVPDIDQHLNIHLASIPPIFAKTSAIINPIIYAIRNSRFRVLLKRTFKAKTNKSHVTYSNYSK
jgi:hypothetical protein